MRSSRRAWKGVEEVLRVATYLTGGLAIVTTIIWSFNAYGAQTLATVREAFSPTFMGLVLPLYYIVFVLMAISILAMAFASFDLFVKPFWTALSGITEPPSNDRQAHPTIPNTGVWDPEEHVRKRYIKGLTDDETFERELGWAMTDAPLTVEHPPTITEGPADIDGESQNESAQPRERIGIVDDS